MCFVSLVIVELKGFFLSFWYFKIFKKCKDYLRWFFKLKELFICFDDFVIVFVLIFII